MRSGQQKRTVDDRSPPTPPVQSSNSRVVGVLELNPADEPNPADVQNNPAADDQNFNLAVQSQIPAELNANSQSPFYTQDKREIY